MNYDFASCFFENKQDQKVKDARLHKRMKYTWLKYNFHQTTLLAHVSKPNYPVNTT